MGFASNDLYTKKVLRLARKRIFIKVLFDQNTFIRVAVIWLQCLGTVETFHRNAVGLFSSQWRRSVPAVRHHITSPFERIFP
jgi:hypothetical protein